MSQPPQQDSASASRWGVILIVLLLIAFLLGCGYVFIMSQVHCPGG